MAAKRATGAEKRKLFEAEALPHLDSVYGMAVRLVHNADDANDLLQETVLRAWRFFDQFQPGTNCRAWLLTILFNNFRNGYRRAAREPYAYIVGYEEFWGIDIEVTPAVLIPLPETEILVEHAMAACPPDTRLSIADLCTGSGCIAVALARELPEARIVATDVSPAALDVED